MKKVPLDEQGISLFDFVESRGQLKATTISKNNIKHTLSTKKSPTSTSTTSAVSSPTTAASATTAATTQPTAYRIWEVISQDVLIAKHKNETAMFGEDPRVAAKQLAIHEEEEAAKASKNSAAIRHASTGAFRPNLSSPTSRFPLDSYSSISAAGGGLISSSSPNDIIVSLGDLANMVVATSSTRGDLSQLLAGSGSASRGATSASRPPLPPPTQLTSMSLTNRASSPTTRPSRPSSAKSMNSDCSGVSSLCSSIGSQMQIFNGGNSPNCLSDGGGSRVGDDDLLSDTDNSSYNNMSMSFSRGTSNRSASRTTPRRGVSNSMSPHRGGVGGSVFSPTPGKHAGGGGKGSSNNNTNPLDPDQSLSSLSSLCSTCSCNGCAGERNYTRENDDRQRALKINQQVQFNQQQQHHSPGNSINTKHGGSSLNVVQGASSSSLTAAAASASIPLGGGDDHPRRKGAPLYHSIKNQIRADRTSDSDLMLAASKGALEFRVRRLARRERKYGHAAVAAVESKSGLHGGVGEAAEKSISASHQSSKGRKKGKKTSSAISKSSKQLNNGNSNASKNAQDDAASLSSHSSWTFSSEEEDGDKGHINASEAEKDTRVFGALAKAVHTIADKRKKREMMRLAKSGMGGVDNVLLGAEDYKRYAGHQDEIAQFYNRPGCDLPVLERAHRGAAARVGSSVPIGLPTLASHEQVPSPFLPRDLQVRPVSSQLFLSSLTLATPATAAIPTGSIRSSSLLLSEKAKVDSINDDITTMSDAHSHHHTSSSDRRAEQLEKFHAKSDTARRDMVSSARFPTPPMRPPSALGTSNAVSSTRRDIEPHGGVSHAVSSRPSAPSTMSSSTRPPLPDRHGKRQLCLVPEALLQAGRHGAPAADPEESHQQNHSPTSTAAHILRLTPKNNNNVSGGRHGSPSKMRSVVVSGALALNDAKAYFASLVEEVRVTDPTAATLLTSLITIKKPTVEGSSPATKEGGNTSSSNTPIHNTINNNDNNRASSDAPPSLDSYLHINTKKLKKIVRKRIAQMKGGSSAGGNDQHQELRHPETPGFGDVVVATSSSADQAIVTQETKRVLNMLASAARLARAGVKRKEAAAAKVEARRIKNAGAGVVLAFRIRRRGDSKHKQHLTEKKRRHRMYSRDLHDDNDEGNLSTSLPLNASFSMGRSTRSGNRRISKAASHTRGKTSKASDLNSTTSNNNALIEGRNFKDLLELRSQIIKSMKVEKISDIALNPNQHKINQTSDVAVHSSKSLSRVGSTLGGMKNRSASFSGGKKNGGGGTTSTSTTDTNGVPTGAFLPADKLAACFVSSHVRTLLASGVLPGGGYASTAAVSSRVEQDLEMILPKEGGSSNSNNNNGTPKKQRRSSVRLLTTTSTTTTSPLSRSGRRDGEENNNGGGGSSQPTLGGDGGEAPVSVHEHLMSGLVEAVRNIAVGREPGDKPPLAVTHSSAASPGRNSSGKKGAPVTSTTAPNKQAPPPGAQFTSPNVITTIEIKKNISDANDPIVPPSIALMSIPYEKQGNRDFYSDQSIHRRHKNRLDASVQSALDNIWNRMPKLRLEMSINDTELARRKQQRRFDEMKISYEILQAKKKHQVALSALTGGKKRVGSAGAGGNARVPGVTFLVGGGAAAGGSRVGSASSQKRSSTSASNPSDPSPSSGSDTDDFNSTNGSAAADREVQRKTSIAKKRWKSIVDTGVSVVREDDPNATSERSNNLLVAVAESEEKIAQENERLENERNRHLTDSKLRAEKYETVYFVNFHQFKWCATLLYKALCGATGSDAKMNKSIKEDWVNSWQMGNFSLLVNAITQAQKESDEFSSAHAKFESSMKQYKVALSKYNKAVDANLGLATTMEAPIEPQLPTPLLIPTIPAVNSNRFVMNKAQFQHFMFSLADMWTESIHASEYVKFLEHCADVMFLRGQIGEDGLPVKALQKQLDTFAAFGSIDVVTDSSVPDPLKAEDALDATKSNGTEKEEVPEEEKYEGFNTYTGPKSLYDPAIVSNVFGLNILDQLKQLNSPGWNDTLNAHVGGGAAKDGNNNAAALSESARARGEEEGVGATTGTTSSTPSSLQPYVLAGKQPQLGAKAPALGGGAGLKLDDLQNDIFAVYWLQNKLKAPPNPTSKSSGPDGNSRGSAAGLAGVLGSTGRRSTLIAGGGLLPAKPNAANKRHSTYQKTTSHGSGRRGSTGTSATSTPPTTGLNGKSESTPSSSRRGSKSGGSGNATPTPPTPPKLAKDLTVDEFAAAMEEELNAVVAQNKSEAGLNGHTPTPPTTPVPTPSASGSTHLVAVPTTTTTDALSPVDVASGVSNGEDDDEEDGDSDENPLALDATHPGLHPNDTDAFLHEGVTNGGDGIADGVGGDAKTPTTAGRRRGKSRKGMKRGKLVDGIYDTAMDMDEFAPPPPLPTADTSASNNNAGSSSTSKSPPYVDDDLGPLLPRTLTAGPNELQSVLDNRVEVEGEGEGSRSPKVGGGNGGGGNASPRVRILDIVETFDDEGSPSPRRLRQPSTTTTSSTHPTTNSASSPLAHSSPSRRGRSGSKTRAPKSYERPTTSSMNRVVIGDDMAGSVSSPTGGTFTVGVARSSVAVLDRYKPPPSHAATFKHVAPKIVTSSSAAASEGSGNASMNNSRRGSGQVAAASSLGGSKNASRRVSTLDDDDDHSEPDQCSTMMINDDDKTAPQPVTSTQHNNTPDHRSTEGGDVHHSHVVLQQVTSPIHSGLSSPNNRVSPPGARGTPTPTAASAFPSSSKPEAVRPTGSTLLRSTSSSRARSPNRSNSKADALTADVVLEGIDPSLLDQHSQHEGHPSSRPASPYITTALGRGVHYSSPIGFREMAIGVEAGTDYDGEGLRTGVLISEQLQKERELQSAAHSISVRHRREEERMAKEAMRDRINQHQMRLEQDARLREHAKHDNVGTAASRLNRFKKLAASGGGGGVHSPNSKHPDPGSVGIDGTSILNEDDDVTSTMNNTTGGDLEETTRSSVRGGGGRVSRVSTTATHSRPGTANTHHNNSSYDGSLNGSTNMVTTHPVTPELPVPGAIESATDRAVYPSSPSREVRGLENLRSAESVISINKSAYINLQKNQHARVHTKPEYSRPQTGAHSARSAAVQPTLQLTATRIPTIPVVPLTSRPASSGAQTQRMDHRSHQQQYAASSNSSSSTPRMRQVPPHHPHGDPSIHTKVYSPSPTPNRPPTAPWRVASQTNNNTVAVGGRNISNNNINNVGQSLASSYAPSSAASLLLEDGDGITAPPPTLLASSTSPAPQTLTPRPPATNAKPPRAAASTPLGLRGDGDKLLQTASSSASVVASLADTTTANNTSTLPSSSHPHSRGATSIENELFPSKPTTQQHSNNTDEFAALLAAFSHHDDEEHTTTTGLVEAAEDDDTAVVSSTRAATTTWDAYLDFKDSIVPTSTKDNGNVKESLIIMALAGPLTSMRILSSTSFEVDDDISAIGKDAGLDVNRLFKSAILAAPPSSIMSHNKGITSKRTGGGVTTRTTRPTPDTSMMKSSASSSLGHINPLHSWLAALPDQSGAIAASSSSVVCTLRRLWTFNEQEVFRMNSDEQLSVSTTTKTVLCHRVFGSNNTSTTTSSSPPSSILLSKDSGGGTTAMRVLHRILQSHSTIKYLSLRVRLSSSSSTPTTTSSTDVDGGISLSEFEEFVNLWHVTAKAAWEGLTGLQFPRLLRSKDEVIDEQPSIALLPLLQTLHLEFEATSSQSSQTSSIQSTTHQDTSSRLSKVLSNVAMIANWRPNLLQFGARGVQLLPPSARSAIDRIIGTCGGNLTTAIIVLGGGGAEEVDVKRFFLRPASYNRYCITRSTTTNNTINKDASTNNDALTYMWWDYHTGFAPTAASLLLHPPSSSTRSHLHQPASRALTSSTKTTTKASQITFQIIQTMIKWFVSEQLSGTKIHVPEAVPNLLVDRSNRTPWGERRSSTEELRDAPNKLHPMYGSTLPRTLLVEPCLDGEKATPLLEEIWAALPLYGAQPLPDVSSLDFYNMDAAGAVQHVLRAVLSEQLLEYLRTAVRQRASTSSSTAAAKKSHHGHAKVDESDPSTRSLFAHLKPLLDEVFADAAADHHQHHPAASPLSHSNQASRGNASSSSSSLSLASIAAAAAEYMGGCVMRDHRHQASLNSSIKMRHHDGLHTTTTLPLEEYVFGVVATFGKSPAFTELASGKSSTTPPQLHHHISEAAQCLILDALSRQLSVPITATPTTTTTCPPSAQLTKEMRDIQNRPRQCLTPTLSRYDELSEFLRRFDTTTPATTDHHHNHDVEEPVIRFGALHAVGIIPTPSTVSASSQGTKVLPLPSVLVGRLRELNIATSRNPMVPSTIQTDKVVWPSTTNTTPIGVVAAVGAGSPLHPSHIVHHDGDVDGCGGQVQRVVSLTGAGDTLHRPSSSLLGSSSPQRQQQHSPRSTSPQRPQETAKAFYVEAPLWC